MTTPNLLHPVAKPIRTVLVANRGEIAVRVMRTCHVMGLGTVAVYSDADVDARHVRLADVGYRLGPAPARDSYLQIDRIIAAAHATGADAIHPGYGFLSENASFAHAVAAAGLTFIGPSPTVIALLGSKQAAKHHAIAAGVPVVPGYSGDDQSPSALADAARQVGFPVLIKASAGGGGKGMRIVRHPDELTEALAAAKREAMSGFGDDTLILERYIERPRHVEIQILGDHHGTLVHLWERECSIQRRHQKVIEEAPSPALSPALRATMGAAGVAVGRAVNYTNAGTVEFIVAPDGNYYFLEVNTRLQVEHPVTEATTGLDLVREQIRIARGEPLGYDTAPAQRGHAIEVRLCAEDPDLDYLPTIGRFARWQIPQPTGIRIDSGVETGTTVGIHYDPLLAKIIAHAATRDEAAGLLAWSLERAVIAGVTTNREHLARILRHPDFLAGALDTQFLERHRPHLTAVDPRAAPRAVVAATLWLHEQARSHGPLSTVEPGWRNVWFDDQRATWRIDSREISTGYRHLGNGHFSITIEGATADIHLLSIDRDHDRVAWQHGDERHHASVIATDTGWHVAGPGWAADVARLARFPDRANEIAPGSVIAPMPGKVIKVGVATGDAVALGATLVVLEAMKMELPVKSAIAGRIESIAVAVGDQVTAEQLLAVIAPD
jgi:propionyl-CoA carboxylase alpha chain